MLFIAILSLILYPVMLIFSFKLFNAAKDKAIKRSVICSLIVFVMLVVLFVAEASITEREELLARASDDNKIPAITNQEKLIQDIAIVFMTPGIPFALPFATFHVDAYPDGFLLVVYLPALFFWTLLTAIIAVIIFW